MQIKIDGELYTDTKGEISDYTVIQVCQDAGVTIPRFCYHDRLSVAGNCRMCLVEVSNAIKPMASCAIPRTNNMEIYTNSTVVKKAREGIMEFLLLNHPLDCPICDQGGECDLQDQAMLFGNDRGRFYKYKRAVTNKNCGPLIKTMMTRCIHCTRCVRYSTEVAGLNDFGATGRGNNVEIGSYIERTLKSEISGNIIDLCPVGALTSKPYAFTARSWELKSANSIDIHDAMGSNVKIDVRGNEIMRVLPRLNESINEEWITDKTRFSYDGLTNQRLDNPKLKENGLLKDISWKKAIKLVTDKLANTSTNNISILTGDMTDGLTIKALKDLSNMMGVKTIMSTSTNNAYNTDFTKNFLFNESFEDFENTDACLLVGCNLKLEAPLLNARLLKLQQTTNISIGYIGSNPQTHINHTHIGNNVDSLIKVLQGKHKFSRTLFKAKNPTIIIGSSLLNDFNNNSFRTKIENSLKFVPNLLQEENGQIVWNGLNLLTTESSSITANLLGFNYKHANIKGNVNFLNDSKVIFAANVDNVLFPKNAFVIYQGHHGDKGALQADIILPGVSFIEKESFYANSNGFVQFTSAAVTAPGQAKEDWKIVKAISEELNISLPYSNKDELISSCENTIGNVKMNDITSDSNLNITFNINHLPRLKQRLNKAKILNNPKVLPSRYKFRYNNSEKNKSQTLNTVITNYFRTNVITNASKVMSKCSIYRTKSNFTN